MTKKDYELIARAFAPQTGALITLIGSAERYDDERLVQVYEREYDNLKSVAYRLVISLEQADPRFDSNRFFTDCGFTLLGDSN